MGSAPRQSLVRPDVTVSTRSRASEHARLHNSLELKRLLRSASWQPTCYHKYRVQNDEEKSSRRHSYELHRTRLANRKCRRITRKKCGPTRNGGPGERARGFRAAIQGIFSSSLQNDLCNYQERRRCPRHSAGDISASAFEVSCIRGQIQHLFLADQDRNQLCAYDPSQTASSPKGSM